MSLLSRTRTRPSAELRALHEGQVDDYATALSVSADGSNFAIASGEGKASIYDCKSGARQAVLALHERSAFALAFSPKAQLLASGGADGALVVVDATGQVRRLHEGKEDVEHVAWSGDGTWLACTQGRSVVVVDPNGEARVALPDHESTVTGVAFDRSGKQLYASCYGGVKVWSVPEGKLLRHYAWKGSLITLSLHPEDKVVACASQEGMVHFWRTATGQDADMSGYPSKPRQLAWDALGTMLATSGSPDVTVWDFGGKGPEGTRPMLLRGHQSFVSALRFAPKKALLASGGEDTGLLLWMPRKQLTPLGFAFLSDTVTQLAFHPSQRMLFAADAAGKWVALDTSNA